MNVYVVKLIATMNYTLVYKRALIAGTAGLILSVADATISNITDLTGANSFDISAPPDGFTVVKNPNDGILKAWDEVQNFTLTEPLRVDRVFDENASFVSDAGGGDFFIAAGTTVSSHYFQWDPGNGSAGRVTATIELDSRAFAFITADDNLFDSDDFLGLPGIDYNDFVFRGLEDGDTTTFNNDKVDISWAASSPGDWTRLITAFSPAAAPELTTNNSAGLPATVDFEYVRVGTTSFNTLKVQNTGGDQPAGLQGTVPTPTSSEFALSDPAAFGPLAPGAFVDKTYAYSPDARGEDSEAIGDVDSNDVEGTSDADAPVTLSGTGVGPVVAVEADDADIENGETIDFGEIESDETASVDVDVENTSDDENGGDSDLTDLTIVDYIIMGDDADKFSVIGLSDSIVISQLSETDFDVVFDPQGMEGMFTAVLKLFTDEGAALGGDGTQLEFDLVGVAIPEPAAMGLFGLAALLVARRRR